MFRRVSRLFVLTVPVLLSMVAVWGPSRGLHAQGTQTATAPSGRAIADKFVEAMGGADAFAKISSLHVTGPVETADGIRGTFEMFRARPDKLLVRVTFPSMGTHQHGYDGKVGWELGYAGTSVLRGRRLSELAHDAQFDAALRTPAFARELTMLAETKFGGRPAYRVKAVYVTGVEQTEYFDVETGLLLGWEGQRDLGQNIGVVPTVTAIREYRTFGPLKQPHAMEQRSLGLLQRFTMEKYDYDAVAPETFALPAAIKALLR